MVDSPGAARIGNWMQTFTGRQFGPVDPRADEIVIEDVARALAMTCRFGGHVRFHYSVAQHSFLVSLVCPPEHALWGLLHDASEAYLGDVVWPLKRAPAMAGYKDLERRMMQVVCERFGLGEDEPPEVSRADLILLATEKRDVVIGSHKSVGREADAKRWHCDDVPPMDAAIVPWSPERAEAMFLARFRELGGMA